MRFALPTNRLLPPPEPLPLARQYRAAILWVGTAAALLLPIRDWLNTIDVAMVFLLAVVAVAVRSSRGPAIGASILAIVAFDILFVPPYYRLAVEDGDFLLTFLVMLVVALLMSHLGTRVRAQATEAGLLEQESRIRFELNEEFAAAETPAVLLDLLTARIGALLGSAGRWVAAPSREGGPALPTWPDDGVFADPEVRMAASLSWRDQTPVGRGTARGAEVGALLLPVSIEGRPEGVLAFAMPAGRIPSARELRLALAMLSQGCDALAKARAVEAQEKGRLEVAAEQLRTALLSSLSHDLRTPLANIEGAASTLVEDGTRLPTEVRGELARGILAESRRMHQLIANLLDMVRVESGTLAVHREWQPLEEALGVAYLRLEERLQGRDVSLDLPKDLPLVWIDELLVEQVFINLLENAIRHTPEHSPITVTAWPDAGDVVVEVADRGPGVPHEASDQVFEKFVRVGASPRYGPPHGAGLGLSICRGIITAHGGRIWVGPRPGGGAAFRFTLPLAGSLPRPAREASE